MALESLLREYDNEMRGTRRMLERIPTDRYEWRPHPKSFTIGDLAAHIVDSVDWVEHIFAHDEFDFDPRTYPTSQGASLDKLLAKFDARVVAGHATITALDDDALHALWRLKVLGTVHVERTKVDAIRDFTFSHIIHHRGQLSVYLRLLDVPVPGVYGPSADDQS
jgi:uncharacterized damage-inducible protein DinB